MAPQHDFVHLGDIAPRRGPFRAIERIRANPNAHWFSQCVAEAIGVFLFTYTGGSITLAFALGTYNGNPGVGSLFGIGVGFAIGLALAIVLCSGTSGGHFGWNVTASLVVFAGFPPLKGAAYMIAQWFGGFVGYGFLYQQYSDIIKAIEADMVAKGIYDDLMFTPNGVAGVFALYANPKASLGNVFLTEFVACFAIGLAIWGCLDPTNFMASPPARAIIIPAAYAVTIGGFLPLTFAANTGRDLGGRMVAIAVWGTRACGDSRYAAIAALTNIPATLLAVTVYETFLADSARVLNPETERYFAAGAAREQRAREDRQGLPRHGHPSLSPPSLEPVSSTQMLEKATTATHSADATNENLGLGLVRHSVDSPCNGSEGTLKTTEINYIS